MKVVIDTNVLVSGLLKAYSSSGQVVRMAAGGILLLCCDSRIILEYEEVLKRPKFGFNAEKTRELMLELKTCGYPVSPIPLEIKLKDPDDAPFLEAAIAGEAGYLITGNSKHYPMGEYSRVRIVSPDEFLECVRKRK